jgi:diadenosine tetraphosphatase ApaH/serine/threonine PP2A family protein phosphatase
MAALAGAGAAVVMGDHDQAVSKPSGNQNSTARRVIDWTRPLLSEGQKAFLAGLPMTHRDGEVLHVHASANSPGDWIYVTDPARAVGSFAVTDARLILVGHRHVADLMSRSIDGRVQRHAFVPGLPVPLIRTRRWLAVVGSVGQPRDGVAQAAYAVLDETKNELSFLRVGYDVTKTVAKLRAAGLPESLAMRLSRGI